MKTELKDVLHLYLGCECKDTFNDVMFVLDSRNLYLYSLSDSLNQIKPILRPLSSMTEEEAVELISLYIPKDKTNLIGFGSVNMNQLNYKIGQSVLNKHWDKLSAIEFQYLLSKGFDLFGLIDNGLALPPTP